MINACNPQKKISGNYTYETECLGIELDGSQTLKAWGVGRYKPDAVEQAIKNGIRDVLFNGIRNGKSECELKPVIFEVNAQKNHEEYFNKFFADGGVYREFINTKDQRLSPKIFKDRKRAVDQVNYGVIIRVLRPQLKAKMIADEIITEQ